MNKLNLSLFLIILVAGYGLTHLLFSRMPDVEQKIVPSFSFIDLDGKEHHLAQFQDKTIILNFWATWCAPCVKEFPTLMALARENEDVVLIALSSDLDDKAIDRFLYKYGHNARSNNVYIARDTNNITADLFNVYKLPETFIIDRMLRLRYKFVGANWTKEEAQAILDGL